MNEEKMQGVFISGVSSGLGYGLARAYLDEGAQVYGISRRVPGDFLEHENFHHTSIDLSRLDAIDSELTAFLSRVPHFDMVILNAGVLGEIQDMSDADLKDLKYIMDVNLWSNKVILDNLLGSAKTIRQIVSISSGASQSGHRGWSGYSISKVALNMMTQLYANENERIHFCALAPGLIDTAMQEYISSMPGSRLDKYPVMQRLRESRGTAVMPHPLEAARLLMDCFPKLLELPSGSYADVRKL